MDVISVSLSSVIMTVVNADKNKDLLDKVPHRKILDLAAVFWLYSGIEDGRRKLELVDYQVFQLLHCSESDLYLKAKENTYLLFPPIIKSMKNVLDEMNEEVYQNMIWVHLINKYDTIYMITNYMAEGGAVVMFHYETLQALANEVEDDLFIIPSSTEEILVVKCSDYSAIYLQGCVYAMNRSTTDFIIILSDSIYRYGRKTGMLQCMSMSPPYAYITLRE